MNRNIELCFWNYVKSGVLDKKAVSDWKELGMTVAMSFEFDIAENPKSEMLEILDECQRQGIKLIICDTRTHYRTCAALSEDDFRKGVREAYEDFGKHPATYGFFAGDEPYIEMQEPATKALKILNEIAPELDHFINLFPFWVGDDFKQIMGDDNRDYYYNLVDKMIKGSGVKFIGYDRYTQCLDSDEDIEGGLNMYFSDLNMFRKVSKANGIPFWNTVLSTAHWVYRVPTEDDIRWQIYTSLAHGARGVMWFFVYMRSLHDNYRNSPIDCGYKRTEMFPILARQQRIFKDNFIEIFNKIELTDVYHYNKVYEGCKEFKPDGLIKAIKCRHDYNLIVSYYKEFDTDKRWVSVVNGHQRHSNQVEITLSDDRKKSFWLAPGQMGIYCID